MFPPRPAASGLILAVSTALIAITACGREPTAPLPIADVSAHRSLPAGEVVGFTAGPGNHAWLGLPFATPPVGERRWRSPEAAPRWPGVRDALAFGSPCSQLATPFAGVVDQEPGTYAGDEDCLYLNVYAPRFEADAVPQGGERRPVMVWIHGGGNSVGHASFYDGGTLAQTQDVVVVTINYRLGPFGWFRHAALREGAANAVEASGNFGTLDQMRALQWVQENIVAFGGDPGNVTVFGESAGGRDVIALLVSPLAKGLFHRAIVQSGNARALALDEAESFVDAATPGLPNSSNEILARLLVRSGRAADRSGALTEIERSNAGEISAFLRATPPEDLVFAYVTDDLEGIPDVPNIFSDGVVLPSEPPLERLATAGGFNDVPTIFGTNRDESKIFMFASPTYVQQWLGFLPRLRDPDQFNATAAATSLAWKLAGADAPATAMRSGGATDVYVYRWDWDEEPSVLGADLGEMIGAAHGFEIPFVFGHYDLGPRANVVWTDENRPGRDLLSSQMMSYWTEFARTGRPGRGRAGDLVEWSVWASDEGATRFMLLDTAAGGGLRISEEGATAAAVEDIVANAPGLERTRCAVAERTSRTLVGIGEAAIRLPGCEAPAEAARK